MSQDDEEASIENSCEGIAGGGDVAGGGGEGRGGVLTC
jgi:hypothetical protein